MTPMGEMTRSIFCTHKTPMEGATMNDSDTQITTAARQAVLCLEQLGAQNLSEQWFIEHGAEPEHEYRLDPQQAEKIRQETIAALKELDPILSERAHLIEGGTIRLTEMAADAMTWDSDPLELARLGLAAAVDSTRRRQTALARIFDIGARSTDTISPEGHVIFILE